MATMQTDVSFTVFKESRSSLNPPEFGQQLTGQGFAAVRRFLDDFRIYLQHLNETELAEAEVLLDAAKRAVPEPGKISPSWVDIWKEYGSIIRYKRQCFEAVPPASRTGEWQVLIDNPYSNGNIAVYPGLSFVEASYMFAYFRTGLEKNEFVRLQKIETVITQSGADEE